MVFLYIAKSNETLGTDLNLSPRFIAGFKHKIKCRYKSNSDIYHKTDINLQLKPIYLTYDLICITA